MTYLILQIALLLGAAALIGIFLGWWFKASRTPAVAAVGIPVEAKPAGFLPASIPDVPLAQVASEEPPLMPEPSRVRQELSEALLAMDTVQNALRQESELRAEAEQRLETVLRRVEEAEDTTATLLEEKVTLKTRVAELTEQATTDRTPTRVTTTTALLSAERYKLRKARDELETANTANAQAKETIASLRTQLGLPEGREKRKSTVSHGLVLPVPGAHPDNEPKPSDADDGPNDLDGQVVAAAAGVFGGAPFSRATTRPGPRPQAAVDLQPRMLLTAPEGPADDIRQIAGIGPKLERLLNELGIYHYRQLASLSDADLVWLDDKIPGFQTRYENRDWRGQSTGLDDTSEQDTDLMTP